MVLKPPRNTKTKDIPIIFLTANTNKEIIENALKTTPSGYISKPFNDRELKYIIEIAIKKSKDSKIKTFWRLKINDKGIYYYDKKH